MARVEPTPGVMDIAAYVAGAQTAEGFEQPVRLASNEAALGPSPRALEAAAEALRAMDKYPDPDATAVRRALAGWLDVDPARLVCGTGSEALIAWIARAYLRPGVEAIIPRQAFPSYRIAALGCGATVVSPREKEDFSLDVDAMLASVTERTRVVFLANPNNPTGGLTPASEIARLRAGLPDDVLLIIDAAYRDYVTRPDYTDGRELVGDLDGDVVVLGTFSKSFALGGMRVGWAYASADVVDVVNRVRPAFPVALPSQAAALAALGDRVHFDAEIAHVLSRRETLAASLRRHGFRVHDPVANFVVAEAPAPFENSMAAMKALARHGVLVRPLAGKILGRSLRITVGSDPELARLDDALTQVLAREAVVA